MKSGVVALRNLKTDRVYLFFSEDIPKDCAAMRFTLDLGLHPCQSLQKDYTETGLEVFRFDTLETTEDPSRVKRYRETLDTYV